MNDLIETGDLLEVETDESAKSLRTLAERLIVKNDFVLCIRLARRYTSKVPGDWQGIELLKWIRILGIHNHCVLVCPREYRDLHRIDPANEIVLLEGMTLCKEVAEAIGKPKTQSTIKEVRDYFKRHLDTDQFKHITANRFGLERLQYAHSKVDRSFSPKSVPDSSDLQYESFRFAHNVQPMNKLRDEDFGFAKGALERLRSTVRKLRPTVILVDDMADRGWAEIYQSILGRDCRFISMSPKSGAQAEKLAEKIGQNLKVWMPHLLIMDLRLLQQEETFARDGNPILNYKTLLSYRTIEALNLRQDDDLQLRILYSTASKDLSKILAMQDKRKFAPNGIFCKEGLEQKFSPQKSLSHYVSLLTKLNNIIGRKSVKSMLADPELTHPDIEKARSELASNLATTWARNKYVEEHPEVRSFDEVYVDTNAFLRRDKLDQITDLLRNSTSRLRIPKATYFELRAMADNVQLQYDELDFIAGFFVSKIDELQVNVVDTGLSDEERTGLDAGARPSNNMADRQIVNAMRAASNRILVISNDREDVRKEVSRLKKNNISVRKFPPDRLLSQ